MSQFNEPWSADSDGIVDADGNRVFDEGDWRLQDGNRERIVACVNACRELSDEMLALANNPAFKLAIVNRRNPTQMVVSVEKDKATCS